MTPAFEFDVNMAPDPRAPGAARHVIDGLAHELPDDVVERFRLVASELVTNAINHAGDSESRVRLVAAIDPDRVRLSVIDSGRGFDPDERRPEPEQQSGWGLFLVRRLCDRWGVEHDGETVVWCELDVEQGRSTVFGRQFDPAC